MKSFYSDRLFAEYSLCVCATGIASAIYICGERGTQTCRRVSFCIRIHGDVSMVLYSVNVASASVFVFWKSIILWWHSICMQPQRTAELCPVPKRISVIFYFILVFFLLSLSHTHTHSLLSHSLAVLFLRFVPHPSASSFALNQKLSTSPRVFLRLSSSTTRNKYILYPKNRHRSIIQSSEFAHKKCTADHQPRYLNDDG